MKITVEKDQYDQPSGEFKTRVLVFETNEISLLEVFEMVKKNLHIISINGKYDWRDKLFEGLIDAIDKAAPVIIPMPIASPCPLPHVFPTVPSVPWTPMQPLIGDSPYAIPTGTVICSGNTNQADPLERGKVNLTMTAMTQGDGMGDDAGFRGD